MDTVKHLDHLSLGEPGYLSAATHLARLLETPSPALRWQIARDYERAGDVVRARTWYAAVAEDTQAEALAALAATRLAELRGEWVD